MKVFYNLINVSVVFTSIVLSSEMVRSQTGNMSDITGINPGEMISPPTNPESQPVGNTPSETGNMSDNTGVETEDIVSPPIQSENQPVATPNKPIATENKQPDTPTESVVDNPIEDVPTESVVDNPIEDVPTESVVDNPIEDVPTESVVDNPIEDVPTESVVDNPVEDTPTESVVDNPVEDTPTESVVDNPVEDTPTESVVDNPVEDVPTESVVDNPIEDVPTESVVDNPVEDTPTESVVDNPVEDTPTESVVDNPVEDVPTESVVDNPVEDTPTESVVVEEPKEKAPDRPISSANSNPDKPKESEVTEPLKSENNIPVENESNENVAESIDPTESTEPEIVDNIEPSKPEVSGNNIPVENESNENVAESIDPTESTEPEIVDNIEPSKPEVSGNNIPVENESNENVAESIDPTESTEPEIVDNIEPSEPQLAENKTPKEVSVEQPSEPLVEQPTEPLAKDTIENNSDSVEANNSNNTETNTVEEEPSVKTTEETKPEVAEKPSDEGVEVTEEESISDPDEEVAQEKDTNNQDVTKKEIDVPALQQKLQDSPTDVAVQLQEEFQAAELVDYSGLQLYGQAPSVDDISQRLGQLWQQTGKKAAFINVSVQSNQVESFVVLPSLSESALKESSLIASNDITKTSFIQPEKTAIRGTVKNRRKKLLATARKFREEVSNARKLREKTYLESSQQLYRSIIAPIEAELEKHDIDILVFSMDSGLRLLPIAALHDGEKFLIEKYAVALVPSFGLTDTRYVNISKSQILAMGASQFTEQKGLPTMPLELANVTNNYSRGEVYLNEDFTIDNFKQQNLRNEPFRVVHLGTHAQFKSGNFNDSYIQFYDKKLKLPELRNITNELGWNSTSNTPVELLVLSACETALGNDEAELGFAGLAVQAGVKSALASLWYVSDLGTLALMGEFYDQLGDTFIKAEALRKTQLQMLTGNVNVSNGNVVLSNGENIELPGKFPKRGKLTLSHPYFWSSFTLIGNWN